jgi:MFS family permease
LLLARVFAGLVADQAGWRAVYAASSAIMLALATLLWLALPAPAVSAPAAPSSYPRLIASMFTLLRHNRVLQVRGVIVADVCRVRHALERAGVPAERSPYAYSHTAIGAFGWPASPAHWPQARAGR